MSQSKHTPGPWSAQPNPGAPGEFLITYNDAGNWLAEVFEDEDGAGSGEADARLIAAAPDLLEALKRLESTARILPESMDEPGSAMSQARAAISRAEGRTEPKALLTALQEQSQ